jgi:hypothetical protein
MASFHGISSKATYQGHYIDGHERDDVVEARDEFLNKMTSLGFFAFLKFTK